MFWSPKKVTHERARGLSGVFGRFFLRFSGVFWFFPVRYQIGVTRAFLNLVTIPRLIPPFNPLDTTYSNLLRFYGCN